NPGSGPSQLFSRPNGAGGDRDLLRSPRWGDVKEWRGRPYPGFLSPRATNRPSRWDGNTSRVLKPSPDLLRHHPRPTLSRQRNRESGMLWSTVYTATTQGSAARTQSCESCGESYSYLLSRSGSGSDTAFLFASEARKRAYEKARADLETKLTRDHDDVPCP